MKRMFIACLAAIALQASPAPVTAATPAVSPLAGRWAIDVATLPMPVAQRPRRVVLEFKDAGNGRWSTRAEIVDPRGATMTADSTLPLDGTPGPITGNYGADVASLSMPAPNVLVMQLVDHGTPASTRIYTVAADRDRMTESKAFFSQDGKPILMTIHFTRVP
ncbi:MULTISPECIES: LuxR family transcriptional regulator [Stenotrophomonas]|uniref:LuxR family transcriptional regulator n=1 Tax=Stenotrophomonas maltophilia TaxID=40324 RepID=A0A4S2CYT2_STEMA|nr:MULTISPECIES: LuxR family transcriptional regulator [Stenotrophomonas]MBD3826313.1 LuxR family transcriptional regulator [Stenotrophomonas sp.]TGY33815.1 LuxR family transcriptional regulator [Stenotrophomonas maltophilia]